MLLWLSIVYLGLFNASVWSIPKSVIIIRHAEKIPGLNHLDQKGYERAAALPYFFSGNPLYNNPEPSYVFAAGLVESDSSVRNIETCAPTANHLKKTLNIDFKPKQTKDLANELLTNPKYDNACILICWEHNNIRPLSIALGAEDPGFWPHNIYDQVYKVTFDEKGNAKLEKHLQKLMFGDRATFADSAPSNPPDAQKNVDED
jgi:hypothetical protein